MGQRVLPPGKYACVVADVASGASMLGVSSRVNGSASVSSVCRTCSCGFRLPKEGFALRLG